MHELLRWVVQEVAMLRLNIRVAPRRLVQLQELADVGLPVWRREIFLGPREAIQNVAHGVEGCRFSDQRSNWDNTMQQILEDRIQRKHFRSTCLECICRTPFL